MAAVTCSLQRGRRSHWWRSHRDDPNDNEKEEDGGSLQSEEEEEEEEEEEAASDGSWASEEDLQLPGGAVPMAPDGPAAQPQPYRQLKVEDCLAYLDQVKMKFEKQPQIYNKVCACVHARCLDGACAATRSRVAPGAIVMDTLLRASRTRTRLQTHEISRARARPVAVPRHHEGVQGAEHRHAGRHRPRTRPLLWAPRAHSRLQHLPGAPDAPETAACTSPSTSPRCTPPPPQGNLLLVARGPRAAHTADRVVRFGAVSLAAARLQDHFLGRRSITHGSLADGRSCDRPFDACLAASS